jgi:hypothetical protein
MPFPKTSPLTTRGVGFSDGPEVTHMLVLISLLACSKPEVAPTPAPVEAPVAAPAPEAPKAEEKVVETPVEAAPAAEAAPEKK